MHRSIHHGGTVIDSVSTGMNGNGCSGLVASGPTPAGRSARPSAPPHRAAPAVPPAPAGRSGTLAPDLSAVLAISCLRCPVSPVPRRVLHRGTRVAVGAWSGGECRSDGSHRLDRPRLATSLYEPDRTARAHILGSRSRTSAIRVQRRMIGHKSGSSPGTEDRLRARSECRMTRPVGAANAQSSARYAPGERSLSSR